MLIRGSPQPQVTPMNIREVSEESSGPFVKPEAWTSSRKQSEASIDGLRQASINGLRDSVVKVGYCWTDKMHLN